MYQKLKLELMHKSVFALFKAVQYEKTEVDIYFQWYGTKTPEMLLAFTAFKKEEERLAKIQIEAERGELSERDACAAILQRARVIERMLETFDAAPGKDFRDARRDCIRLLVRYQKTGPGRVVAYAPVAVAA